MAKEMQEKEAFMRAEREKKRIIMENRGKFNEDIRRENGRLTMKELKQLNSVYKRDYIQFTLDEDTKVQNYLTATDAKIQ